MKYIIFIVIAVLVFGSCGPSEAAGQKESKGTLELYNTHCGICHGKNGRKGLAGAKILPESQLSIDERVAIITNGKGQMMPYKKVLSTEEIRAIAEYTMSFK